MLIDNSYKAGHKINIKFYGLVKKELYDFTMIRNYNDFIKTLHASGFSMGGDNIERR